jgi:2-hydroxychromene-2-carboxylate isomerase
MSTIDVIHFTDPGCPWAYSATPSLAVLRWRFGAQLQWRHVMIGLREAGDPLPAGFTPQRAALMGLSFRRFGMPFAPQPKPRYSATAPACKAIIATRLAAPDREWAVFRALQFMQFTTTGLFDEPDDLRQALSTVEGIDADAIVAAIDSDEVTAAYEADREEARTAAGSPTEAQGRSSDRGGGIERYTAPSIIFAQGDNSLEVGGFQPLEAYDTALANLDRSLERRDPPEDPTELLEAFPDGLVTAEVAAIMAPRLGPIDYHATEAALIGAMSDGAVARVPAGDSALWIKATSLVAAG